MSTSISNSSIHNNMENQDIIFIQRHHHYFLVGQSTALPPVFIPVSLQREDVSTASQALPIINEDGDPRPEPGPANQTSPDQADRAPTKPAVTNSDKLHQSDSVTDAGDSDDMAVTNQMTKSPAAHTVNTVTTTQDNATLAAVPDGSSSSSPVKSTSPAGLPSILGDTTSHPSNLGDTTSHPSTLGGTTHPGFAGGHLTTSTPPALDTNLLPSHVLIPIQSSVQPSTLALIPSPTQPLTMEHPQTSAPVHIPVSPPQQEVPSELNVGDEDKGPHLHSPLDPVLAGLVSVFIVTTAVVSVILFLKFRQRTDHPDFHRLQDLPMDDLMEDTPLSRYTYTY
ncbi:soluble scavenger receptor cysteine-rich domain-containing protein SSC5D isoform X1 [Oncorhynchus mykiss]|uniref:soluble scavenger receptor cysteine-rich domain-containing protein SSC5D isoform X1 n=1 Tax=Oncorhynchus mykiss TaxID=8022 RepID=UPI001877971A|nr:soluble scavenger receptor cysteine-rich domain-containing protein SSC5D isoform X1 [Oncorhynchus mykiss]